MALADIFTKETTIAGRGTQIISELSSLRKFFFPKREETLAEIQEERQQTLIPSEAAGAVTKRERQFGFFGGETKSQIESPDFKLSEFLKAPRIDPTFAVGQIGRRVAGLSDDILARITRSTKVEQISAFLRRGAKVISTEIDDLAKRLAKEKNPRDVENILNQAEFRLKGSAAKVGEVPLKIGKVDLTPAKKTQLTKIFAEKKPDVTRKFKTIHAGGEIKVVDGEPVKIIDGVDTFIHKGDSGFVVSEVSTGRFLANSASREGAITKANFNISNVGVDKFKKVISENQLPKQTADVSKELQPLAEEARKFKTADEFLKQFKNNRKFTEQVKKQGFKDIDDFVAQNPGSIAASKIGGDFVDDFERFFRKTDPRKTTSGKTIEVDDLQATDKAIIDFFNKVKGGDKPIEADRSRQVNVRLEQIAERSNTFEEFFERAGVTAQSLIATVKQKGFSDAREFFEANKAPFPSSVGAILRRGESQQVARPHTPQQIQKVSLGNDNIRTTQVNKRGEKIVSKKDPTNTVEDNVTPPNETEEELITTRKFKQTDEWKAFARYAEKNLQDKDISPPVLWRHTTMTMERVAEFLDGGIGGETFKKIVKPVYDSAKEMTIEGNRIKNEIDDFKVLEGSSLDRDASILAQGGFKGKTVAVPDKVNDIAKYTRNKYDEFLIRLNEVREKLGIERINKRSDYITHINELNTLSELFGGLERVSIKAHISFVKSQLLDQHPDWPEERAFDAAKRKVEGLTGVGQYVDARQPAFKFAKQRLTEYEKDPSIIRSFSTYMPAALRYIHQGENVARNKAFKDVLPANSREYTRIWNTEQVAGRQPPSFLSPTAKRILSAFRGTLGANTILGNMATTAMQLTSWAQVVALAGPLNTFMGLGSRLRSYIPGQTNLFTTSRTRALRNLDIDIGLGDSFLDQLLIKIGKHDTFRDPAARTRQAVDVGREILKALMETADQFTVGATYQAFYRKGVVNQGLSPDDAMEFAEIMTGKTQANYFKEGLPPFLNTIEGKTLGQFGTYGMNQWEMFKNDFGRDFKFDEKSPKSVKTFFKQFFVFLAAAYMVDWASEETFGRQPYDVKSLIDDSVGFAKGEVTGKQLRDTSRETVTTYIPFMGSVKFKTLPPIFEFGGKVLSATFGTGDSQEKAIKDLQEKWAYNVLLPYGGNQARKSLTGVEAITDVDLPFVRNPSKNFKENVKIDTNIERAKAIIFGPYSTKPSVGYFETRDQREGIKEKFEITKGVDEPENIEKYKQMSDDEFNIYIEQYATSTQKRLTKKRGGGRSEIGTPSPIQRESLESIFR